MHNAYYNRYNNRYYNRDQQEDFVVKKLSGLVATVVLAGLNLSFASTANAESDKDFLASYKASFMESCVKEAGGAENEKTCQCVLADVVAKFSVDELKNSDKVADYIQNVAMEKCQ